MTRKIDIRLTEHAGGVELSVENNGRRFPATLPANPGTGLNVMRYRAAMIGASLSVAPGQTTGARVTCTLRTRP